MQLINNPLLENGFEEFFMFEIHMFSIMKSVIVLKEMFEHIVVVKRIDQSHTEESVVIKIEFISGGDFSFIEKTTTF
jgi:hypothetical protein